MSDDEKYDRILRQVFEACDVEDYKLGVTIGENRTKRWINITFAKVQP